jgi:eukaryotic-like serine/threonine-protein kinase
VVKMAACPDLSRLQEVVNGAAGANDEVIAAHLEICPLCQAKVDEMLAAGLPNLPRPSTTDALFLRRLKSFDLGSIVKVAGLKPKAAAATLPVIPNYEVIGELGRGGMGVVYRARHRLLRREVAIKMLQAGALAETDRARLLSEAETVARFQHANIAQLFEVGEVDGQPFLVFEYVAGGNLAQRLQAQPQPPLAAAALVEILARAVHEAHQRHIVHRDLKPANVLLVQDGQAPYGTPKLADFGLAKRLDAHSAVTRTFSGTPAYMAPEQITIDQPNQEAPITPATDVYALGVILYEMLTGRPPFLSADWLVTLMQIARDEPKPLRTLQADVPRDLETICLKCLRKEPARRYAAAAELADDLRRFQNGEPIRARPVGRLTKAVKWTRRHPFLAAMTSLAVAALVFAFTTLGFLLVAEQAQREAERREREQEAQLRAEVERNFYFVKVSQANLQWRNGDVGAGRQSLESCPVEFRDWEWHYVRGLVDDGLWALSAPAGHAIHDVAVSSRWIVAATDGRTPGGGPAPSFAIIWNAADGREVARLPLPNCGQRGRLIISADGRRLITPGPFVPGADRSEGPAACRVWDLQPLAETGTPPDRPEFVIPIDAMACQFEISADGGWLAAESSKTSNEIILWNLAAGAAPARKLVGPNDRLKCLAISADGSRIAACFARGERRVWDTLTGKLLGQWTAPPVAPMSISPNNRLLIGHEATFTLVMRDLTAGTSLKTLISSQSGELSFSRDSRFVIQRRSDLVRCWDLGNVNQRIPLAETRGDQEGGPVAAAFAPDGVTAATGGIDGSIRVWNLQAGALWDDDLDIYRGHDRRVNALAFSPDARRLISGGADGVVRVWDLTRPQRYRVVHLEGKPATTAAIFFANQDRWIGSVHGSRLRWSDCVSGARLTEHDLGANFESDFDHCRAEKSANGARLALGGSDGTVHLFSLGGDDKPEHLRTFDGSGGVTHIAISADGRTVAAATAGASDREFHLFIWDAESGALVRHESGGGSQISALAVSPDGQRVAAATAAELRVLAGAAGGWAAPLKETVEAMAYSRDGGRLAAVGGPHGNALVWDAADGHLVWRAVVGAPAAELAYNPDGTRLAVLTKAGEMTLWDAKSGVDTLRIPRPQGSPALPTFAPAGLCFSSDGLRLAATDGGSRLLIWEAAYNLQERRVELRAAANHRANEWHWARLAVCKQYPFAFAFHQKQIQLLKSARE